MQAGPPLGFRICHPHPPCIPSPASGLHIYPELQGTRLEPYLNAETRLSPISWLSLSAEGSGRDFCCLLPKGHHLKLQSTSDLEAIP